MLWPYGSAPVLFILLDMKRFLFAGLLIALVSGCASRPDHLAPEDDLTDASYALLDQDSTALLFPEALAGAPAVVTAIYTHCPDVCLMTMQNVHRVRQALGADTSRVRFLTVSFDPARDTPRVLRAYAHSWDVAGDWRLATGDSATVARLMDRLGVRTEATSRDTLAGGRVSYALSHTDKMLLLDAQGRVVETYGGSAAPPDMVATDARALLR